MNELQARLERLEKRQAKTARALERVKSELEEVEAMDARLKVLTIEVGGLLWARVNLGTDIENPNGKYYTFDEAQALCPQGWTVPACWQWAQLHERTDSKWTTRDGINGRLFIDKENGNELFLIAAGYRNTNGTHQDEGMDGYFWSSSSSFDDDRDNLYFSARDVDPDSNNDRNFGFLVRPVKVLPSHN